MYLVSFTCNIHVVNSTNTTCINSMCAYVLSRFSHVRLFATLWTIARQAPLSMGFSRKEYWSGLTFPSLGDLLDPEIKPKSPAWQAGFLPPNCRGIPSGHIYRDNLLSHVVRPHHGKRTQRWEADPLDLVAALNCCRACPSHFLTFSEFPPLWNRGGVRIRPV